MTMYIVAVVDSENLGYNRSPYNRNLNVSYPTSTERFSTQEHELATYKGWWLCESKEWAEQHAEDLAKRFPTKIVKVAKVITEYQSETPKIAKKSVSEKGVLPA